MSECRDALLTRRRFLLRAAAGAAYAMLPGTALASLSGSRDPRLLVIVLRGALDGLAAVPAVGDGHYADLRAGFDLSGGAILPLDGFFALNANLPTLGRLYGSGQATILHGVATSYRERSHFDGQDMLETGMMRAGGTTGWLNRATETLKSQTPAKPAGAVSLGFAAPLIMRGKAPVMTWAPQVYPEADQDTLARIMGLYEAHDPVLAKAMQSAFSLQAADSMMKGTGGNQNFLKEIEQTTRFFSDPEGPRIAALSSDGWDTHARQNPKDGRLANLLRSLDEGIAMLEDKLQPVWADTIVAIVTEFGRTAAINGTNGTDHGTGTAAFLIGGALKGGRVVSDWPGLAAGDLYEGRDLKPTLHINGMFKGLLRDHFGLDEKTLSSHVFPDSRDIRPIDGLVA